MAELPRRYAPKEFEADIYRRWEEAGLFRPKPAQRRFSMVIPPPNVTGSLHLGHALNNSLQDFVARYRRLAGEEVLWVPGTDHAGIATQAVVERRLAEEGLSRHQLGRKKFVEKVWEWKEEYQARIRRQLKALGALPDWSRERFTLDEVCSRAVFTAFQRLFQEGLIYRGKRFISWCPRCETALSDLEVEHRELEGRLWYVRYPLPEGGHLTVATTRPETILADVALAVHPEDPRYRKYIGKKALLPVPGMERELLIVGDEAVDPEFGTGVLKVTPGHDPVDYEIGLRHGLPVLEVMDDRAHILPEVEGQSLGEFAGKSREEARALMVRLLKEAGRLEKEERYTHAVGHCQRCGTIIEPRPSTQWFVRMAPLAKRALEALDDGAPRFHPPRWAKVYRQWLENIQDWCISRQLWWGHRIPVWYCQDCNAGAEAQIRTNGDTTWIPLSEATEEQEILKFRFPKEPVLVVSRDQPERCPKCGGTHFLQEVDVLDTWFSSALWPFSVFGWPEETEDLQRYYPTSLLVTGYDIIFFWVARMVMMGLHFTGEVPFAEVYVHGLVLDAQGRKMSKSLGNVVDPMEIIEQYGADTLRFTLAYAVAKGQEVRFSADKLEGARRLLNKLWNAGRLLLLHADTGTISFPLEPPEEPANPLDRWILTELSRVAEKYHREMTQYEFREATHALEGFFWSEFCDWYLEAIKPRLEERDEEALRVALFVFQETLKLFHPFIPFVTEYLAEKFAPDALLSASRWLDWSFEDPEAVSHAAHLKQLVTRIREMKRDLGIPVHQRVPLYASNLDPGPRAIVQRLGGVSEYLESPPRGLQERVDSVEVVLPIPSQEALSRRLQQVEKQLKDKEAELSRLDARLNNSTFLERAPAEVIQRFSDLREAVARELQALRAQRERLRRALG